MKRFVVAVSGLLVSASSWAFGMCGHGMMGSGACPPMGGVSAGRTALYLLLLVLGYWVLRHAEKETNKILKWTGRSVSWIILLASLGGLLCPLFHCGRESAVRCAHGAMSCPFSGGPAAGAPAPQPDVPSAGDAQK